MKKFHLLIVMTLFGWHIQTNAADLLEVYQQAVVSDPVFQQAIAQRLANKETVPLNLAPLLPQASILGGPLLSKTYIGDSGNFPGYSQTAKGYSFTLSATQTVFNFAQFKALSGARAISKQADANLNAAAQDLMVRVAQAYFAVLKDEDNLRYNIANKKAYAKQLDQINQQYHVGLKTITDVYTARASFDTASAQYIAAQTLLTNDRENLRAITGVFYNDLATLSERFPLITPHPHDVEAWVHTALMQNWSVRASEYASIAARENIKQQFAGHLPTLDLQGTYNVAYNNTFAGGGFSPAAATSTAAANATPDSFAPVPAHSRFTIVSLNLGVPLSQGGQVVSLTRQAKYNFQVACQRLEQNIRATANKARQSYLGILSGIKQIQADKQAIKSTLSSLHGLEEGYHVGTQTLVDVLNQQQRVFMIQTQYATDRYAYVNNLLALKQAAGTLCVEDLIAINAWLEHGSPIEDDEVLVHRSGRYKDTGGFHAVNKKYSAAALAEA